MVLFRDNLTYCLDSLVNSSEERYEIVCKTGYCGSWCNILYAAILSKKYSWMIKGCSPSKGVYPCYLFAKDLSEVYLTYMVASGDKYENTLKRIIKAIRELGVFEDYDLDASQMKLGKDPHKYRFATICFKKYTVNDLDNNARLEKDLQNLMKLHQTYGDKVFEAYALNINPFGV